MLVDGLRHLKHVQFLAAEGILQQRAEELRRSNQEALEI